MCSRHWSYDEVSNLSSTLSIGDWRGETQVYGMDPRMDPDPHWPGVSTWVVGGVTGITSPGDCKQ